MEALPNHLNCPLLEEEKVMKMRNTAVVAALTVALGLGIASTQGASKVTIWTDFKGGELAWFTAAAKAFEATPAAKGAKLELTSVILGETRDKFIQAAPKGEGPDLIATIPHDQIGEFVTAGVLEPMTKYLDAKTKADTQASAIDAFNYKGKLFGLPMWSEAVAVVYNKKLIKSIPSNWNAFIAAAQKLTVPEKQEFGFLAPIGIQYHMNGIYRSFGAYVFGKNKDGSLNPQDIGLANEGAVKAAQTINDLRFKYKLIPEGTENPDLEKDLFTKGKVAMWLTGPWDMSAVKDAKIDYGIGLLPKPTGATKAWSPFIGVRGLVMNAYSKNKDVSAAFAQYLISKESQISLNQEGGRLPISKSALVQLKADATVKGFGAASAAGIAMPNIAEMGSVWGPWGDALNLSIKTANPDFADLHKKAVAAILGAINKK
jgi:arabinogalactan oligomer / maltooligosaccharide transport system substrate-binding protein